MSVNVAVIGASGFTGGEMLRPILEHPMLTIVAATSGQYAGKPLHRAHANLRGFSDLKFSPRNTTPDADVVISCLPHGKSASVVKEALDHGQRVVDLSADFRLSAQAYETWYGDHPHPELLDEAVYGLPEWSRDALQEARIVSGVGCIATAMNLALLPLARAGLLADARIVVDAKIGSSAAGAAVSASGMHAHRSRSLRLYAPTRHRHAAEVERVCGVLPDVSVHAAELVRGELATCHVLTDAPDEKELWKLYRQSYRDEPFVRIVKDPSGIYRGPDPKLVLGSNLADVSFHSDGRRIVATCALDNLVKGAAGTAMQCLNAMFGIPETTGLLRIPVMPQ